MPDKDPSQPPFTAAQYVAHIKERIVAPNLRVRPSDLADVAALAAYAIDRAGGSYSDEEIISFVIALQARAPRMFLDPSEADYNLNRMTPVSAPHPRPKRKKSVRRVCFPGF